MTRASLACCKRLPVAALFAVSVLGSGVALAQPKPAPAPPPAASSATPPLSAKEYFTRALDLFKAKKYSQALEQFRLSYAASPSPNSHLYIARCTAQLGETRNAWLEFDKVVDEAAARMLSEDKYRATWDSAKLERDELGQRLGLVILTVAHADPASTVHVGAYPVPPDRWGRAFPVEPGTYDVRVDTPNRQPLRLPLVIAPSEKRALTLDVMAAPVAVVVAPPPAASSSSKMGPLRIAGIAATGVGVVGLAMFVGGGVTSKSTYSTLTKECGTAGGCGGKNVSSEISTGKTQQAVANAGLALGVVGVAAGVTLIVLSTRRGRSDAGRPSADLVVGPSWAGVDGAW